MGGKVSESHNYQHNRHYQLKSNFNKKAFYTAPGALFIMIVPKLNINSIQITINKTLLSRIPSQLILIDQ